MVRRLLLWILRDDLVSEVRLVEIEEEWRQLLTKMSTAIARESKAKQRAVRKALEAETTHQAPPAKPMTRKAALRQRAAALRMGVVGGAPATEVQDVASGQDE